MQASPNWHDGRFVNVSPRRQPGVFTELMSWWPAAHSRPQQPLPIELRRRRDFIGPPRGGLRLTWLGHSSVIIEIDGYRLLTDPVWNARVTPLPLSGPTRFHAPPLALADLPRIDAVMISHDHYDHLDRSTIVALERSATRFVVPLGLGAHLEHWGVAASRITELDWWEETAIGDVRLVATPARHTSGRSLFSTDTDATLWTGWAIVGPTRRVFFGGATGMFDGFDEIGERLGPFDVTLLEVGGYSPVAPDVHLGPEQAVEAHRRLQGRLFFPVHWGTFDVSSHGWTEPIERALLAAARRDVPIVAPVPGQGVEPTAPSPVTQWWPEVPWNDAETAPVVAQEFRASP